MITLDLTGILRFVDYQAIDQKLQLKSQKNVYAVVCMKKSNLVNESRPKDILCWEVTRSR